MRMSVVIPTHQVEGNVALLTRNLESLWNQTMQDFEIVVADNSDNDDIENLCSYYGNSVRYYRNANKGMAQNSNFAIRRAEGELIKILYMDDFLAHDRALTDIWGAFRGSWLVTGCEHSNDGTNRSDRHMPLYNENIHLGKNTIGSPSVLTMRASDAFLFDDEMTWLLDCDLYKRLFIAYGLPDILNDVNVVIGTGRHQMTHSIPDELKAKEQDYMVNKYLL